MNKIIQVFILLLLATTPLFSQVRNKRGLKVISKIERYRGKVKDDGPSVINDKPSSVYDLSYDNDLNLIAFQKTCKYGGDVIIKKDSNTITRVDYEGYEDDSDRYRRNVYNSYKYYYDSDRELSAERVLG